MFDTGTLSGFQDAFLKSITAAQPPQHPALRVHHDTWLFGLIEVLAGTFPATRNALGEEAFNAFARDYAHAHPLTRGDTNAYGDAFANFLAGHQHLGGLFWLPDLARYEYALHLAHHAADATPCRFDDLLDPEAVVGLHPSVQIITLAYDIRDAHISALNEDQMPPVSPLIGDILIGRNPEDAVIQVALTPLESPFLALVAAETSLFRTLDRLNPTPDDLNLLQVLLAKLVHHGLLIVSPI